VGYYALRDIKQLLMNLLQGVDPLLEFSVIGWELSLGETRSAACPSAQTQCRARPCLRHFQIAP
jgi:hypothetical protein